MAETKPTVTTSYTHVYGPVAVRLNRGGPSANSLTLDLNGHDITMFFRDFTQIEQLSKDLSDAVDHLLLSKGL